ncbi:MAG: nitroreductase family protein [Firmicutes bacterium]|nr:nitroreductase family protein [Bacillota bacterium]
MNETIGNIKSRRSIRAFKQEQIKDEELQLILEAGLYAPSAHNQQSWHFTVIQNKEILDDLNESSKEAGKIFNDKYIQQLSNNEKFHTFYHAPTAVIISGKKDSLMPFADCAAATQNMLVAAQSIGIGSCWIGLVSLVFNGEKAKKYQDKLGIPEGYQPYHAVALGYKKVKSTKAFARKENTVNYIR